MTKKKVMLSADVTDWDDEFMQVEPDLSGDNPLIDLQTKYGLKPAQIARFLSIARLRGLADEQILPAIKHMIMHGGAVYISRYTARQERSYEINGKEYQGRAFVAEVKEDEVEDEDQAQSDTHRDSVQSEAPVPPFVNDKLVEAGDPIAYERAAHYLLSVVPGYIWGRLLIVAEQQPDELDQVVDELKNKIDEMVTRLG